MPRAPTAQPPVRAQRGGGAGTAAAAAASPFTSRACQLANADAQAARREFLWPAPAWLCAWLADARDAPAAALLCNVAATSLPAAAALHALRCQSHLLGAAYLAATYATFLQVRLVWPARARGASVRRGCCAGRG